LIPPDRHLALEERILRAVNVDGGKVLDALALLLSSPAFGAVVGVALAVVLGYRHRRSGWWRWVAALGLALVLSDAVGSQILRPALARMRPAYALPAGSVRWIAPAANVGSIPSLHTSNFFAMATVATAAWPSAWVVAYPVATAVGWSRMYVGVHWPGDVLAGAAWGTLCAALSLAVARPRREPRAGRGVHDE
jgi:undecaprenyl-diphosphatase